MKTMRISLAIVMATLFGLTACSGKNSLTPKQDSAATESKAVANLFVRFTPPNTFESTLLNGSVEMSVSGNYAASDPHTNHNWWPDYYNYFQTIRNSNTFEMKDFWLVPYLPSPTWGMFRISQNGSTFTLSRVEGKSYVTVLTSSSYSAIVDRLQFIYINGTPQHKAAINKLDILSYRIN